MLVTNYSKWSHKYEESFSTDTLHFFSGINMKIVCDLRHYNFLILCGDEVHPQLESVEVQSNRTK